MLFNLKIANLNYLSEIHGKELGVVVGGIVGPDYPGTWCNLRPLDLQILGLLDQPDLVGGCINLQFDSSGNRRITSKPIASVQPDSGGRESTGRCERSQKASPDWSRKKGRN